MQSAPRSSSHPHYSWNERTRTAFGYESGRLVRDRGWGGAMSEDTKRDISQAVSSAARWQKLERETLDVVSGLADPKAKRKNVVCRGEL
jgi:hypothetical protein